MNGSMTIRQGNPAGQLLPSAARTTLQTLPAPAGHHTDDCSGVLVFADITAWATGSLTISIQGQDPVSLKWFTVLTTGALVAIGTYSLSFGPGHTEVAVSPMWRRGGHLPYQWRVAVAVADASSITYSLGYDLLRAVG